MPKNSLQIVLLFLFLPTAVHAGVVIKVRAINPLEEEAVAPIKYPLPKEITPDDIIAKRIKFSKEREEKRDDSFTVKYDRKEKHYYVNHKVALAPKEIVTLEIEVKDVWVIAEEEIAGLKKEVEAIYGGSVPEEEPAANDTATALKDEILSTLDQIASSQGQNSVAKAGVQKHISAYQENTERLKQARMDKKMLENLLKKAEKKKKKGNKE